VPRRRRQQSKHRLEHHDQVRTTHEKRRRLQRPRHRAQVLATHKVRRRKQRPEQHGQAPATHNERRRGQRTGHRPGYHDHVRATEATSGDSTSPLLHYRACCISSVHMELAIFTLVLCSSAECSSLNAAASRRCRQRSKYRPKHHDQVLCNAQGAAPRAAAWAPRSDICDKELPQATA